MCRWVTLLSTEPISLSDVVLAPSNSLIRQARDATYHPGYDGMNNAALNADGFGVGWYHRNVAKIPTVVRTVAADGTVSRVVTPVVAAPTPDIPSYTSTDENGRQRRTAAIFRDTFPAWNNLNLRELCMATNSDCIMAHVRAASPNSGVSLSNCHPFKAGRLLFCHNGRIFGYQGIKRKFLSHLSDEAFHHMKGTTDSEAVFGLLLTILGQDEYVPECGSPLLQKTPFGAPRLTAALKKTVAMIFQILAVCLEQQDYCTCNFALTDGETMVVTRYCDQSPAVPPPSLYYAFGSNLSQELTEENSEDNQNPPPTPDPRRYSEEKKDTSVSGTEDEDNHSDISCDDVDADFDMGMILLHRKESKPGKVMADVDPSDATFVVSSNPLTQGHVWHKVPKNSIMWCTRGKHPELRLLHKKEAAAHHSRHLSFA
jgi:predicted glutamine amidotransferase